MKSDSKYRFSLQWGNESQEQIQAGELLEKMGNKKSKFILMLVNEYINTHPEILQPSCKFEIQISSIQSKKQLQDIVKGIVEELISKETIPKFQTNNSQIKKDEANIDQISVMLENLDFFK